MPRVCTVCNHSQRAEIEQLLLENEPLRDVAGRYRVSKSALERHKKAHIPLALVKAQNAAEAAQADTLLEQVQHLKARALTILDKAEGAGDLKTALSAIREARNTLELLAKLMGELDESPTINLVSVPEWLNLRAVVIQALLPFPAAAKAVVEALHESP